MQKNKALPLNGTRHNLAYKPPTKDNHPLCLNAANTFPPTCRCFSRTTRERNSSYGGTKGLPAYAPLSVYTVFHTLTNSVPIRHSQEFIGQFSILFQHSQENLPNKFSSAEQPREIFQRKFFFNRTAKRNFPTENFLEPKHRRCFGFLRSSCFGIIITNTIIYNPVTNCKQIFLES